MTIFSLFHICQENFDKSQDFPVLVLTLFESDVFFETSYYGILPQNRSKRIPLLNAQLANVFEKYFEKTTWNFCVNKMLYTTTLNLDLDFRLEKL